MIIGITCAPKTWSYELGSKGFLYSEHTAIEPMAGTESKRPSSEPIRRRTYCGPYRRISPGSPCRIDLLPQTKGIRDLVVPRFRRSATRASPEYSGRVWH